MTEVEELMSVIAEAWSGKAHPTQLKGVFVAPPEVRSGGVTGALITVAATAVQKHYADRIERLSYTVRMLAGGGQEGIVELMELDYIREGDLS